MRKIRLELDTLQVQSYDTTPAGAEVKGTVEGAQITGPNKTACSIECSYCITCNQCEESDLGTCPGQDTCGYPTNFTCYTCATSWESCTCDC